MATTGAGPAAGAEASVRGWMLPTSAAAAGGRRVAGSGWWAAIGAWWGSDGAFALVMSGVVKTCCICTSNERSLDWACGTGSWLGAITLHWTPFARGLEAVSGSDSDSGSGHQLKWVFINVCLWRLSQSHLLLDTDRSHISKHNFIAPLFPCSNVILSDIKKKREGGRENVKMKTQFALQNSLLSGFCRLRHHFHNA